MLNLAAVFENKSADYYERIKSALNADIAPELRVRFALYCANDAFKLIDAAKEPKVYEASKRCLVLIEAKLSGAEVSEAELKEAAYAAYEAYAAAYAAYAAHAAAYAAHAAADAANAANAANAAYEAYAAANAAHAAAYAAAYAAANVAAAANAAWAANAVSAAAKGSKAARQGKLKAYYERLVELIIEFYGLDSELIASLYFS